MLVLLAEPA